MIYDEKQVQFTRKTQTGCCLIAKNIVLKSLIGDADDNLMTFLYTNHTSISSFVPKSLPIYDVV